MRKKLQLSIYFVLFFLCQNVFSLDLAVTTINETCTANGSLSFSVTNQAAGVPVFYAVYLLPNTTTPIVTTSLNTHGGLVAGSYLVIASQTVGSTTTTDQKTVTIINQIVALTYTVSEVKVKCGNDGQLTVNVVSGVPVSYQLLTGPVTTGLQTSNVFSNLPAGQYKVNVKDNCGVGAVLTYTLTSLTPSLIIGPPTVSNAGNTSCNTLFIDHTLTEPFSPPLTFGPFSIKVTAYPPSGGSPIITTQASFPIVVPSINGVSYVYDLLITDSCGNTYPKNNNQATHLLNFNTVSILKNCNDYIVEFTVQKYITSYTINFIAAPAGFNPALANPSHPGSFTNGIIEYGNSSYYMPLGSYTVEITDSCGNKITKTFIVEEIPSVPTSVVTNGVCGVGANLSIGLNPFRALATVMLTSTTAAYSNPLPDNLSSLIVNGVCYLSNIPFGTYNFNLIDICGNSYTHSVTVIGIPEIPNDSPRPGCSIGDGSIQIYYNPNLPSPISIVSIEIVEAPATFAFPLPYNVSFNITSTGSFSMNSLPEGDYKFKINDSCGSEIIKPVTVIGFNVNNSSFNVIEYCDSFDLQFNYDSNANYITTYHLQKYDPINNVWEHPTTGFDYVPGSAINVSNALPVAINTINYNIQHLGDTIDTYRILKVFFNFSNGTNFSNRCIVPIHEFQYNLSIDIIDAYAFPCSNNTQEVVIVATGDALPLHYSISEKDGQPFVVNNGTSNSFVGLAPGLYKFEVTDNCGNVEPTNFDLSLLQEPEIVASNLCNGSNGQLEIQNFPFVTYQWYNTLNPSIILSTTNSLQFTPFNSAVDVGNYAVQLSTTNANSCVNQTISYTINSSGFNPNAGNNSNSSLCKENTSISLNSFLTNPHDAGGVWTDANGNVLTSSTINPINFTTGNHVFTYTVTGFCAVSDASVITITIKDLPASPVLLAPSLICVGNDVLLEANTITNATYFWTGPNGFTSSVQNPLIQNFASANNGTYFAFVTVNGCNSATEQIILNSNPVPNFTIDGITSICTGQNETLTINPTNFDVNLVSIAWYFENILLSTQTNPTLQINQTGTYKVIINNNGCLSEKEVEVIEKINSFEVLLEQGCNGNQYEIRIINPTSFSNATYSWIGPNNFSSSSQNIIVPNLQIGQYDVEVTDVLGCKSNAFALVENTNCFIPNGFSPDEDGFNDSFDLSGYNVKKIYVYNRWGRLVYDKENYINEWKGQTNNNNRLPVSTYFYVLEFHEGESKTGWVYVTY